MAEIQIKEGNTIYTQGAVITAVCLIIEGEVSIDLPSGTILLSAGDGIGLIDLYSGVHSYTYTAVTDVVVDSYPYKYADSLKRLFLSSPERTRLFYGAALKLLTTLEDIYSLARYECDSLYGALMEYARNYTRFCKQYDIPAKSLPGLEQVVPLSLENKPDDFILSYYKDMEQICEDSQFEPLFAHIGFSTGFLYRSSQDMHLIINSYLEMQVYLSDVSRVLINEGRLDFLDLYSSLLALAHQKAEDTLALTAAISKLFIRAKDVSSISSELYEARLKEYQDFTLALQQDSSAYEKSFSKQAETIKGKLKSSLATILRFANMDVAFCKHFTVLIEEYKKIVDKTETGEELTALRSSLAKDFYELYTQAFFASIHAKSIPTVVRMFFYYGYVDETLCGSENAIYLYSLTHAYHYEENGQVYPFYEWLRLIYTGKKEPRRDAFDQDYASHVQSQLSEGKIDREAAASLLADNEQKVLFELRNLFVSAEKITYGRVATFCPLLSEHDLVKTAENCLLSAAAVQTALDSICSIDFSAYYREILFANPVLGQNHEFIQKEIRPDIILLPNVGTRGVLWQEIEGRNRKTPSCMLLPSFCLTDLRLLLLRLTGEFRWEMCKREQGGRWNDVSNPSLTSEYFDYLQFYKKNKDLSPEAKEKCKLQLQRVKNRYKEAFLLDYVSWILYESHGSVRLNPVTRRIMMSYCPFSQSYRSTLSKNPLYAACIARYENHKKKDQTRIHSIISRIRRNNKNQIPAELEHQAAFLDM